MTHLVFPFVGLYFNLAKQAVCVMTFRKGEDKQMRLTVKSVELLYRGASAEIKGWMTEGGR